LGSSAAGTISDAGTISADGNASGTDISSDPEKVPVGRFMPSGAGTDAEVDREPGAGVVVGLPTDRCTDGDENPSKVLVVLKLADDPVA
jgi:hypothetical protein